MPCAFLPEKCNHNLILRTKMGHYCLDSTIPVIWRLQRWETTNFSENRKIIFESEFIWSLGAIWFCWSSSTLWIIVCRNESKLYYLHHFRVPNCVLAFDPFWEPQSRMYRRAFASHDWLHDLYPRRTSQWRALWINVGRAYNQKGLPSMLSKCSRHLNTISVSQHSSLLLEILNGCNIHILVGICTLSAPTNDFSLLLSNIKVLTKSGDGFLELQDQRLRHRYSDQLRFRLLN